MLIGTKLVVKGHYQIGTSLESHLFFWVKFHFFESELVVSSLALSLDDINVEKIGQINVQFLIFFERFDEMCFDSIIKNFIGFFQ